MSADKEKKEDETPIEFAEMDDEYAEMERQVNSLQEDLKLKALQENAAKDEGVRKTAVAPTTGSKGNTSIFVGGMDPRTTEADLRVFFASCGTIVRVTIRKDSYTQQSKGFAYIEFETPEQAQAALLKDSQSLHGKPLKIAIKRENIPASQRGFRGGGGPGWTPRGRGGAGNPAQMAAAMAMMASMMTGGVDTFNPYGRGRGRGRGRGGH